MRQQRESEIRLNQTAARNRQLILQQQQNIASQQRAKAERVAAAKAAWARDNALLNSGKMSAAEFGANMDSGKYAY